MSICILIDKILEAYPTPVGQDEFERRMKKLLKKAAQEYDYDIDIVSQLKQTDYDYVSMTITQEFADQYLDAIKRLAKRLGWFVHSDEPYYNHYRGGAFVRIVFNPQGRKVKITSRYLYHITSGIYAESIKKRGLIPTRTARDFDSHQRYHGQRTYLFHLIDFENTSKNKLLQFIPVTRDPIVFRVDVKKLKNHTFYIDSELRDVAAMWTDKLIPPEALEYLGDL